jgi:hypothetical protein|tara:strand:+ start:613 stop:855 length:243 start_codon:yes stop_codon:yes gene_type:complete
MHASEREGGKKLESWGKTEKEKRCRVRTEQRSEHTHAPRGDGKGLPEARRRLIKVLVADVLKAAEVVSVVEARVKLGVVA